MKTDPRRAVCSRSAKTSSCLCVGTMCCAVNTLKEPYHPLVWCFNASNMLTDCKGIRVTLMTAVPSLFVLARRCVLQDVSAPTSRLNLLWNILDPDVITAVDKLSRLGLLCVTVEASFY